MAQALIKSDQGSPKVASGFSALTSARLACEKCMYAEVFFLGALGSFLAFPSLAALGS